MKGTFWPSGKKGLGAPLYLEEDGPVLGVIDDIFLDRATGRPQAYKVQASGQILELPAESVQEVPGGFIYRSPWFTEADALVRKLESQELLMPELLFPSLLITDSDRKIVEDAIKRSPALKAQVDEARELYRDLLPRIEAMDKEKSRVIGEIAEVTEGLATARLSKDAYRDHFISMKRRLQVLEASLRRAQALKTRLERTPFVSVNLPRAAPSMPGVAPSAPAATGFGGPEAASAIARPPGTNPEEWKRIRKFRVLRADKDLQRREREVEEQEKLLKEAGGLTPEAIQVINANFSRLEKARAKGPEAFQRDLEELVRQSRANKEEQERQALAQSTGAVAPSPALAGRPAATGDKTCPFCAEPLTGKETVCPGCHADLGNAEKAKPGQEGPGKVDKFFKGGGATKVGFILLLAALVTFLARLALH